MLLCHSCHTNNLLGAIFCLTCGASLLPEDRKRDTTAMLGVRPTQRASSNANASQQQRPQNSERRLRATILNNGRHINLPLDAPLLVGRQDTARGLFPDLDLNNDGGYDSGVSRRHARISLVDEAALVEDLGSANGTFINDQRLQPRAPQRIQPTDEVRFGSLILRIEQT